MKRNGGLDCRQDWLSLLYKGYRLDCEKDWPQDVRNKAGESRGALYPQGRDGRMPAGRMGGARLRKGEEAGGLHASWGSPLCGGGRGRGGSSSPRSPRARGGDKGV